MLEHRMIGVEAAGYGGLEAVGQPQIGQRHHDVQLLMLAALQLQRTAFCCQHAALPRANMNWLASKINKRQ